MACGGFGAGGPLLAGAGSCLRRVSPFPVPTSHPCPGPHDPPRPHPAASNRSPHNLLPRVTTAGCLRQRVCEVRRRGWEGQRDQLEKVTSGPVLKSVNQCVSLAVPRCGWSPAGH